MKCTEPNCHRPALFSCDLCGEERCANHVKACDECGKTACNSLDATCYAEHHCSPPSLAERINLLTRVN